MSWQLMRNILVMLLVLFARPAQSAEITQLLAKANCADVAQEFTLGLRVLHHNFRIPTGFEFFGQSQGMPVFKYYDSSPVSESTAISYIYFNDQPEPKEERADHSAFSSHEWNLLNVRIRAQYGERVGEPPIYQAIIRTEAVQGELIIVTESLELIANIVACAKPDSN